MPITSFVTCSRLNGTKKWPIRARRKGPGSSFIEKYASRTSVTGVLTASLLSGSNSICTRKSYCAVADAVEHQSQAAELDVVELRDRRRGVGPVDLVELHLPPGLTVHFSAEMSVQVISGSSALSRRFLLFRLVHLLFKLIEPLHDRVDVLRRRRLRRRRRERGCGGRQHVARRQRLRVPPRRRATAASSEPARRRGPKVRRPQQVRADSRPSMAARRPAPSTTGASASRIAANVKVARCASHPVD